MARQVSLEQFDAARRAGAHVVDVRAGDEYAEGHAPGTELLPLPLAP